MKKRTLVLQAPVSRKLFHLALKIDKLYFKLVGCFLVSKEDANTHLALSFSLFDVCEDFANAISDAVHHFHITPDSRTALSIRAILSDKTGYKHQFVGKTDIGNKLVRTILRIDRLMCSLAILFDRCLVRREDVEGFINQTTEYIIMLEKIYSDMKMTEQNIMRREKHARSFFKALREEAAKERIRTASDAVATR